MPRAPAPPYAYRAYGCNLASDIALSRLSPGTDPALDTITVARVEVLPQAPQDAKRHGAFLRAGPNYLELDIEGIVHFVALNGDRLLYRPYAGADPMSVQLFLTGSGLGAVLMQRKLLVMHGNAVQMAGACVMCVGPSGAGKSTTAAGLMQRGYRVLSDDVCAINGAGQIVPGMPHIKLWQDAADALSLSTQGLEPLGLDAQKFGLPLGAAFCADPLPVTRVYLLDPHASADVRLERVQAAEKFRLLRDNTYRFPFVAAMGLSAVHFRQLTELSESVSVTRIHRPQDGFHLDAVLDALIADVTDQAPNS